MLIRQARPGDEAAIARVHVDSWRTTYQGIMPDEVLAGLTYESRQKRWEQTLSQAGSIVFVAEDESGQIVGFASGGPERTQDPVFVGELYAVYLLKETQGKGLGRRLMGAIADRLANRGLERMLIWVAEGNPAEQFYQAMGGKRLRTKTEPFGGTEITEIAYGWEDTRSLREHAPREAVRIAYGEGEHHFGHLRLPDGPGPHPVALVIHGGFWKARYGLELMDPMSDWFAAHGIAAWNIEYRRVGHEGGGWPGTLEDVARAADHLRTIAPGYNLDLGRVVAIGHSAGGHLALWLAGRHRPPLAGVISLAGVTDLALMWAVRQEESPVVGFLGGRPEEVPERYAQASPAQLLPLGTRQVLIHGTEDKVVPLQLSTSYEAAARAAGDAVETIALEGVEHFKVINPASEAWPPIAAAMDRLLGRG